MYSSDEEQHQERGPIPYVTHSDLNMSESDTDDESGSIIDDRFEGLNLPEKLMNVLNMDVSQRMGTFDADDSESDDDILRNHSINLDKLNETIQKSKFKFKDFGAHEEEEEQQEKESKKKKSKKPQQEKKKKRRRDKGKDIMDIEEDREDGLDRVLNRFREEASDDEDMPIRKVKKSKPSGRKSRKNVSSEDAIDENGERMMRTTSLLDDTSSSDEEDDKPLSKKEEEELYRENERLRRTKKVSLKPVYHVKSFDDFIKRRQEKEEQYLKQQAESNTQQQQQNNNFHKTEDSDSDIEIIGDPRKIAAKAVASPDRPRYPLHLSPMKPKSSYKEFNRRMLEKITNQGYEYRMKMEAAAKARGQYASATERAKRLLEREKNTIMINEQVNQHFEKQKKEQESDSDDEDYQDDILDELSGSEDEDEIPKRPLSDDDNKTDEEDDLATAAFKRWKNKKIKKSIFDDDDEEEVKQKTKPVSKPEPKHSIANFFKSKEKPQETDEAKPLSRLVQKEMEEEEDSEEPLQEDDDEMDIDVNIPEPKQSMPLSKNPMRNVEYFEEEAEEEEDEFYGAGGSDGEEGENLDEFEKDDLLVEDNDEHVDEAVLREAFNKQDEESDKNLISRIMTDVTGGGLRRKAAAAETGLMLEDIDLLAEEDDDLIAIRRMQAARRRKLLKMRGGDTLENLMKDPKTAAFAKAFQAIPDEPAVSLLSDEEGVVEEEDKNEDEFEEKKFSSRRIIIEEDEDEEEDEKQNIMDDFSDEEHLVISELDEMSTPLRGGGFLGVEDEVESFEIETMRSPVAARKAKSLFASPSSTNRFRRLIAEASNAVNGTADSGGPRVGFGSVKNVK